MRRGAQLRTIVFMHNVIEKPESNPKHSSPTWARAFATLYNPMFWTGERAGARALRQQVLSHARGRTVEIGAGTGLNVPLYPDGLDELILAEPDRAMRKHLEKKLLRNGRNAHIIDAPAEHLPFADGSVDTVVSTFVLCTVEQPDVVLREIGRVLQPDGQFVFLEHVRSESPALARWQDRLHKPWRGFARGCRCNRATAELIASCGFVVDELEHPTWHAMPPLVRPLIIGRARIGVHHA
jgi:SAM-dependent methyltransferase